MPGASAGTILVVDDDDALRALVVRWLASAGMRCVDAPSGLEALRIAHELAHELDAIVCDVMMPGIDGFEVISRLQQDDSTRSIPVVLLTARATAEADIVRGAESGAVDHLSKPVSGPVLIAKVSGLCERSRQARALREKLRTAEENATIDALTGLFNRRHFEDRLRAEAAYAKRHRRPFAIAVLDIDHFKSVNDTFGHDEGDRALRAVADAMRDVLRTDDMPFRYGGEEFVMLLRACTRDSAVVAATRLQAKLRSQPLALGPDGVVRMLTFSAGIASAEEANAFSATDLVARADAALYRAKAGGRDRVEVEDG